MATATEQMAPDVDGISEWNQRGGRRSSGGPPSAVDQNAGSGVPSQFRRSGKSSAGMGEQPAVRAPASHYEVPVRSGSEPERDRTPAASSSVGADGQARKPAFDRNGPVEAVALQSDWQFWNIFSDVRTIGKGHFAKVKQVMHNESHEQFAAKILDKSLADNDIEDLVREFQMLRALRHQNIIRLYAAYETPRKLYLVTELSTGGELLKHLGSTANVYSEDQVKKHIETILHAVAYMHAKHCVHRDLKPENVLLSDTTENASIKIVDLGLSRFFEERKLMRTICGTHKYLAPELVQCDRGQIQGYDKAIDMWGVGLLAYIMLFGFNPFARDSQRETHNAISRCDWRFPDGFSTSEQATHFVSCLLKKDPNERHTAEQALRHRWLDPNAPPSPNALMTSDPKRSVKQQLWEFNAQRMLSKVVKGAHRRLSTNAQQKLEDGAQGDEQDDDC